MSHHDELKERVRQSRPFSEPLSPTFKRQLRAHLVEKAQMKKNRFSIKTVGTALGAALILVAVPLLFWLWQSSLKDGVETTEIPAVSAPVGDSEGPGETLTDSAWIIASDPEPPMMDEVQQSFNFTMGYNLVKADEAELVLKLALISDEGGGWTVSSARTTVIRGEGEVDLTLSYDPHKQQVMAVDLVLSMELRDPAQEAENQRLFQAFPEGYHWTAPDDSDEGETAVSRAEILSISQPLPYDDPNLPPDADLVQVDVVVGYTLVGHEMGTLDLAFEYSDEHGGLSGGNVQHIEEGNGTVLFPMTEEAEYFDEMGFFKDGTQFDVKVSIFDETGRQITVYPEGVPSSPAPDFGNEIDIQGVALGEGQSGEPMLDISVWYQQQNPALTGTIEVMVEDGSPTPLATGTITVDQRMDTAVIPVPLDMSGFTGDTLLRIAATLQTGGEILADDYPLLTGSLQPQRSNELWIESAEVVTETNQLTGQEEAFLNLVVGYALDHDYEWGSIEHSVDIQTASWGRGGGGSSVVTPGVGTKELQIFWVPGIGFPADDLWPAGIQIRIEIIGMVGETRTFLYSIELPPPGGE